MNKLSTIIKIFKIWNSFFVYSRAKPQRIKKGHRSALTHAAQWALAGPAHSEARGEIGGNGAFAHYQLLVTKRSYSAHQDFT